MLEDLRELQERISRTIADLELLEPVVRAWEAAREVPRQTGQSMPSNDMHAGAPELDESQRAMVAGRLANLEAHRPKESGPIGPVPVSQPEAAKRLNVGTRTVKRAKAVLDKGAGSPPDDAPVAPPHPPAEPESARQRGNGAAEPRRECEVCGESFALKDRGQRRRFCSNTCRDSRYRKAAAETVEPPPPAGLERVCAYEKCGAEFTVAMASSTKMYCRGACKSAASKLRYRADPSAAVPDPHAAPEAVLEPPASVAPPPDYVTKALVDLGRIPAARPGWPRREPLARYQ